jgi:hypothetical protein
MLSLYISLMGISCILAAMTFDRYYWRLARCGRHWFEEGKAEATLDAKKLKAPSS